ncbi:hypothetical protein EDB87DRAFT_1260343 [Lactarius vividus]|nr:hypothetical protein EDB87DRAFT_1260343 [Lactarius vividus]
MQSRVCLSTAVRIHPQAACNLMARCPHSLNPVCTFRQRRHTACRTTSPNPSHHTPVHVSGQVPGACSALTTVRRHTARGAQQPGREHKFHSFPGKVICGARGRVVGVQGIVAIGDRVRWSGQIGLGRFCALGPFYVSTPQTSLRMDQRATRSSSSRRPWLFQAVSLRSVADHVLTSRV